MIAIATHLLLGVPQQVAQQAHPGVELRDGTPGTVLLVPLARHLPAEPSVLAKIIAFQTPVL